MKFPREFFEEEERDGFVVAEMMKRAWAAELEVFDVVRKACEDNGIPYFAVFGTLLGAVRHKGFIPWDDDMDIGMLRPDYDRFMSIAGDILPEGFVVTGIYASEPRLRAANPEPQGRVIADETVFTLPKYMNRFHSFPYMRVGIDVYPLDYLPADPQEQIEVLRLCTDLQTTAMYLDHYRKNLTLKNRLRDFEKKLGYVTFDIHTDDEQLNYELRYAADRLIAGIEDSGIIQNVLYLPPPSDVKSFEGWPGIDVTCLGEGVEIPFEVTTVRAPERSDVFLRGIYGEEFMTPVRNAGAHDYKFYSKQEAAFRQLLDESGITDPVDVFCRNWHRMNGYN